MVRFDFSLGSSSEGSGDDGPAARPKQAKGKRSKSEESRKQNESAAELPSRRMVLRFGRRPTAGSSSDSSASSEDSEANDSEEEAFPIGKRVVRPRSQHGLAKYAALDIWDVENTKGRQKLMESWLERTNTARAINDEQDALFLAQAQQRWRQQHTQQMSEVTDMLQSLEVGRQRAEAKLYSNFEQRNANLWADIEAAIKTREADEAALQAARERQSEAEKLAKEAKAKAEAEEQAKLAAQKEADESKRQAEEAKTKAAAAAQVRESKLTTEKAATPSTNAVTTTTITTVGSKDWEKWHGVMQQIKTSILPAVTANPTWRKACRDAKRAMTPKVGQLTNSSRHIVEIAGIVAQILDTLRNTSLEAYVWGLNHLSKATIKQAETEVTARLQGAFPLARFILHVILSHNHVDLADVFMARLVKKCFWISGQYPPRSLFDSDIAYQKALGYTMPPDGTKSTETLMGYAQRMNGIVSLYSAIVAVSPPLPNVPVQFRPAQVWTLLASLCRPPICSSEPVPQLLEAILYMTGKRMLSIYGRQFTKLWNCLATDGLQANKAAFKVEVGWVKASCVKLMLMLEDWSRKGITEPEGLEPDA